MSKILIVDDEAGIRQTLQRFLVRDGYEVETAMDAAGAKEILDRSVFDVVITDIIMPHSTGIDLLREIRESHGETKVIVITGEPTVDTAAEALRLQAFDYLAKPMEGDRIRAAVRNAVRMKELEDENRRYQRQLESLVEERTREIRDYSDRLSHIAYNADRLLMSRDPSALAGEVLKLFAENMDLEGGSLYRLDGDRLNLLASLDPGHAPATLPWPPEPGTILSEMVRTKEALRVSDLRGDSTLTLSGWGGYRDDSWMALPCFNEAGRLLLVVTLHNKAAPPFSDSDLILGRIIAHHALNAFQNLCALDALDRSERTYRLLVEEAQDVVFTLDASGRIRYISPSIEHFGGLRAEDCLDSNLFETLFGRGDPAPFRSWFSELALTDEPRSIEAMFTPADGAPFFVEVKGKAKPGGSERIIQCHLHDIRERKEAEKRLTESEIRFRTLVKNSNDILVLLAKDGRQIYVSDQSERIVGYPAETLIGRNGFEFIHPDDLSRVYNVFETGLNKPNALEMVEYRHRHASGGWVHLEAIGCNLLHDPLISAIVLNVRDVTERQRMASLIKESKIRYDLLTEATGQVVYECNSVFNQIRWTAAARKVFGYSQEELVSTVAFWADSIHPDDRARAVAEFDRAEMKRAPLNVIYRYRRMDGRYLTVHDRGFPHDDPQSGTTVYIGVMEDITEQRKTQAALELSEKRLRQIIDLVPHFIFARDRDGRYVMANKAMADALNLPMERIIGRTSEDLFSDADFCRRIRSGDREVLDSGKPQMNLEENLTDGRGRRRALLTTKIPFHFTDSELPGVLGVSIDITDLNQLRELFHHAQKMESVGRLVSGVAHDFNNVLTSITGNASMAISELRSDDPLRDTFDEIFRATDSATSLTRQLLAFSRRDSYEPKVLNLNDQVDRIKKMLLKLIGEDIRLSAVLDPELGNVRIDPGHVEQMLINLAVNSRDAMPNGGRIVIETRNVDLVRDSLKSVREVMPGSYARLSFQDTGSGIPPDILPHIFEPFFTTKNQEKGTGLGLSILSSAIERNSGYLEVESEVGRGTTFRIYFRRVDRPVEAPKLRGAADMPRGEESILLVEDDEMLQTLASRALQSWGYRLTAFSVPREALDWLAGSTQPVHMLMTDVIMPEMNGRVLADHVLALRPEIKVLFTSGYSASVIASHDVTGEKTHFISKPYSLPVLARKIREILDGRPLSTEKS